MVNWKRVAYDCKVGDDFLKKVGTCMIAEGFVYLDDQRIIKSMRYASNDNFLGRPVAGYHAPVCIMTKAAAQALIQVQNDLDQLSNGYRLKIFDAYRPTEAVDDFITWSQIASDQKAKAIYYPDISKETLFDLGYISKRSGHSRGSTVDLTITRMDPTTGQELELEMGTLFDYFGERSHTASIHILEHAKKNRAFLKDAMEKQGFENYPLEWWHFTLKDEPFPDTYFNFPIA